MKLIIEVTEDYYEFIKNNTWRSVSDITILDGIPYEERPHGEWIKHIRCIECSVCKDKFFADDEEENCQDYEPCTDLRFNFCPNCGADMRGDTQ